ncbi:hypothetical protein ABW19_dt0204901 [Dactylella cylindrospora]|nr:hypothetical protein ABW19_dt0204901 [Dactylella cylindrospora]
MNRPLKHKDGSRVERPLPATPSSPPKGPHSTARDLRSPKKRDRNRLRKSSLNPLQKSFDKLTLGSPSSPTPTSLQSTGLTASSRRHASESSDGSSQGLSGSSTGNQRIISARFRDPDITPKPLNVVKRPVSDIPSLTESLDINRGNMTSRWSTSTSDVASRILPRKESKRKIFGIPISFKRRVKSEQIPASLKISSGFFGGRFGGSKLNIPLANPGSSFVTPTELQWRSSRASSQMTARELDGDLSDEEVMLRNFEQRFYDAKEKDKAQDVTPKGNVPQRRHTLTGNLIGMAASLSTASLAAAKSISRHSSVRSHRSSIVEKAEPTRGFLSLFPKPPKRDPAEVMHMISKSGAAPFIMAGTDLLSAERLRSTSSPLPVNLRDNLSNARGHQRNISEMTVRPQNYRYNAPLYPTSPQPPPPTPDIYCTPSTKRKVIGVAPFATPGTETYTGAQARPVLTNLHLQVTADMDCIEVGEIKDTWVVVEINGNLVNNRECPRSEMRSLDVIFLLDLSYVKSFAS